MGHTVGQLPRYIDESIGQLVLLDVVVELHLMLLDVHLDVHRGVKVLCLLSCKKTCEFLAFLRKFFAVPQPCFRGASLSALLSALLLQLSFSQQREGSKASFGKILR